MKEVLSSHNVNELCQIYEQICTIFGESEVSRIESPVNMKPLKTCFVYQLKQRACFVTKDFIQPPGVDFFEAFHPVIGLDIVSTVLTISAIRGWNLRVLNFKQACINVVLSDNT